MDRKGEDITSPNDTGRLLQAASAAMTPERRYSRVYVLLISWEEEEEDLWYAGMRAEIDALQQVFKDKFNYHVERKTIASNNHTSASIELALREFLNPRDNTGDLFIIYYAGHSFNGPRDNRNRVPYPDPHSFRKALMQALAATPMQSDKLLVEDMNVDAIPDKGRDAEQERTWSRSPMDEATRRHIEGHTNEDNISLLENHTGGKSGDESKGSANWQKQKEAPDIEADPSEHNRCSSTRLLHCFNSDCMGTVAGQSILQELRSRKPTHLICHHENGPSQKVRRGSEETLRISPSISYSSLARISGNLQGTEWRRRKSKLQPWLTKSADLAGIIGSLTSAAVVTEHGNTERKPPGILLILTKVLAIIGHDKCASPIPEVLRNPSADTFVTCSALWILCSIWLRHQHQGDRFQDHAIAAGVVVALGGNLVWSVKRVAWGSFGVYVFFFVSVAMYLSFLVHGIARNRGNNARLVREEVEGYEDAKVGRNGL